MQEESRDNIEEARKHSYLARVAGVVVALAGGFFTGKTLRRFALLDFVKSLRAEENPAVSKVVDAIKNQRPQLLVDAEAALDRSKTTIAESFRKMQESAGMIADPERKTTALFAAKSTYDYLIHAAEEKVEKVINLEVMSRMKLNLQHSPHRNKIIVFSAVSAVVLGVAVYMGAKRMLGYNQSHRQKVMERRAAADAQPPTMGSQT